MTYFGFLTLFLGPPLMLLFIATWRDQLRNRPLPPALQSWPISIVLLAHVIVAVLYTTPWDNYLVATRVWWYDSALVTGVVLGWVPIEEYTFFVLQTILTGLWTIYLARRLVPASVTTAKASTQGVNQHTIRWTSFAIATLLWLIALFLLISPWQPGTYLGLELAWALLPIMLQLGFGGDILWHYRKLIFWTLAPITAYLSLADALAIGAGTWTINPAQSTGILLGNLPVEELIFFLLTNVLVTFGVILTLSAESQARIPQQLYSLLRRDSARSRLNRRKLVQP